MGRRQGRITKEDIQDAGFRRWDGRHRITTDWVNVFNVWRSTINMTLSDRSRNLNYSGPMAMSWSICDSQDNQAVDLPSEYTPQS